MPKTSKCGKFICLNSDIKFLLGVNYFPRKSNIKMWSKWNMDDIRNELNVMRSLGIRAVRFFIIAEDFMDNYGNINEDTVRKLKEFLDLLREYGIIGFPTLFVGHMSGRNWRVPFLVNGDPYDEESITRFTQFVTNIVNELKNHEALGGWILTNEISLFKRPENRDRALAFLSAVTSAIKRIDPNHVVSSGDVFYGPMQEEPNVRGMVDYIGPHLYLYHDDPVLHGYLYGAHLDLASNGGSSPVLLEEFGFSTLQYPEEWQARFINEVLYTAIAHESSGAFIWCFADFINDKDPPYEWRPLELGFGIIDKFGKPKLAADVVSEFSKTMINLEELGLYNRFRRMPKTTVVIPFYAYKDYEFVSYKDYSSVLMSDILLTMVGAQVRVVYELDRERIGDGLVLMPSVPLALTSTWDYLLSSVKSGSNLYVSLLRQSFHESPTHLWDELFGVKPSSWAGSKGRVISGNVKISIKHDFGSLRAGDSLSITVGNPTYLYEVKPTDATVIATLNDDLPVVFMTRRGNGVVILSIIPFEHIITVTGKYMEVLPFYKALIDLMGSQQIAYSSLPELEVQTFYGDNEHLLFIINHSINDVVGSIKLNGKVSRVERIGGLGDVKLNDNVINVNIERKSGLALRIE
ncbi:glycoside hydrolase 5 family protein [Vulcanisaeta distributa]|uniref:Glycoside hydrolase family 42 protein n=1 Tax=Vulcanisaeta distributa (strain DSM 14429 / JCM 11212 / NBRC 100878 / IC-017) TaxID=572478 RepID=E1QTR3_VULDI|nr:glycoside hydrolase [Vulcanisaeta distributa]ADN50980.1 glycoside hydrolase family 42 protein [Vulcanisaeta distributa DSM 14429]